jgi:hypothetical protein
VASVDLVIEAGVPEIVVVVERAFAMVGEVTKRAFLHLKAKDHLFLINECHIFNVSPHHRNSDRVAVTLYMSVLMGLHTVIIHQIASHNGE